MTPVLAPPRRSAPTHAAGRALASAPRRHDRRPPVRPSSGPALVLSLLLAALAAPSTAAAAQPPAQAGPGDSSQAAPEAGLGASPGAGPGAAPGPAGSPGAGAGARTPTAPGPADSPGVSSSAAPGPADSSGAPGPTDSPTAEGANSPIAPGAPEGPAADGANSPQGPATPAVSPVPSDSPTQPGERPPRVDGVYLGGTLGPGVSFARVNDFPTPDPLFGAGGTLRVGEVLYRWLSIGVEIAGNFAYRGADPRQRLLQGAFIVDFGFYPLKKAPLSLRAGFGAGGGAIRERGRPDRSGFGGAVFTGAVRYEFFPGADRRRPRRGGGFSLGPELGWLGFMPAAKGRPMAHTVYLGLFLGFYFGS